jgi:hypothetical protein
VASQELVINTPPSARSRSPVLSPKPSRSGRHIAAEKSDQCVFLLIRILRAAQYLSNAALNPVELSCHNESPISRMAQDRCDTGSIVAIIANTSAIAFVLRSRWDELIIAFPLRIS